MAASDATRQKIESAFASLPEDIKKILPDGFEANPELYDNALRKAGDNASRNAIIQKFLLDKYESKLPDFDGCLGILTRICDEVGILESDNPFIGFIKSLNPRYSNSVLTSKNLILLNDLYADDKIDFNDLAGLSESRNNHIVFMPGFYASSDPETLIDSWNFLSDSYKVGRLNFRALSDSNRLLQNDALKAVASSINGKKSSNEVRSMWKEIRDAFLFPQGKDKGTLRSANDLKMLLTIANSEKTDKQQEWDDKADERQRKKRSNPKQSPSLDQMRKALSQELASKSEAEAKDILDSIAKDASDKRGK